MGDEFVALGGSLLAAAQDVLETVLQKVDAAALCWLKAASVAWCAHVRRELCNRLWVRLCRREGQPEPAGVDSITDLDVECLNDAGRPWEVVVAGRQLPQLARLHGYGFVVNVQAVREADLEEEEDDDDDVDDNWEEDDDDAEAPLGGDTLRSCIQGKGNPPHELLLAAVACAASGTVRGVPVPRLREDAIDELDLYECYGHGTGVTRATLLGLMLPAATSLRSLNLGRTGLGPEGGAALAAGLKGNSTLQVLHLESNGLGDKGGAAIAECLKGNSTLQSLNLAKNQLCGIDSYGEGIYTAEGITKMCEALKGSAATSLNVGFNDISGDAAKALAKVVLEHASMTDFCGISLVALRENSITELDLRNKGVGVPGAIVLSKLLPSAAALTSLSLDSNQLCNVNSSSGNSIYTSEGIIKLCEGLKGSAVTSLNLAGNQLCGVDRYGNGTYITEGITKLCEGLKGSAVTSLNLAGNQLCGLPLRCCPGTYPTEGITKLCVALRGSALTSLNIADNDIGDEGASTLAAILKETQITTLDLNGNSIGVEGVSALAAVLKETMISNLDVGGNNNGVEGVSALAAVLKETQITHLKIDHNQIGDESASALTAILKETQITNLCLHNNGLGPKGFAALAEGLKGNSTLKSLNLDFQSKSSQIRDKDVLALAAVVKETKITELRMRGNFRSDQAKQAIRDAAGHGVSIEL